MPTVSAQGKTFTCETGANLRKVLLNNGVDLYNEGAKVINCLGFGSCGTCAVEVQGEVSEPKGKEKFRLSLPPHSSKSNLRLACQTQVLGDVTVTKHQGFWGQKAETKWEG
ncbi:2Fe-2S iron-sulfur cluster-binding protein [Spirulina subsalsa]|uniref:2Fe-2S iron-sulfur cluster-binding protein n=1 Tax=Spirulina subsalsa TaxID=54311 RepID=UPI0002D594D7|nr:2Fe-2S iron-sulfur cluster-binding protein [Spirulina subsalsa]